MTDKLKYTLNKTLRVSFGFRSIYRVYCSYNAFFSVLIIIGAYFTLVSTVSIENLYRFTFAAVFMVEIIDTISFIMSNFLKITPMLATVQRLLEFSRIFN